MEDPFLEFFKSSIETPSNSTDNLLFLRIPKNASSSIMQMLGTRNVVKKYEKKLQESLDKNIYKDLFDATHARPHELKEVISGVELKWFRCIILEKKWDLQRFLVTEIAHLLLIFAKHLNFMQVIVHLYQLSNKLSGLTGA